MSDDDLVDEKGRPLNLVEPALTAAWLLKREFPLTVFTSGRRTRAEQAAAMAGNVWLNRTWIQETYLPSKVSRVLQEWVDSLPSRNPTQTAIEITREAIALGLERVLLKFSDEEVEVLSKHFSGLAFDVKPVPGAPGQRVKARIRRLPGLQKFLEREGGLVRWHAQFLR